MGQTVKETTLAKQSLSRKERNRAIESGYRMETICPSGTFYSFLDNSR